MVQVPTEKMSNFTFLPRMPSVQISCCKANSPLLQIRAAILGYKEGDDFLDEYQFITGGGRPI